MKKYTLWSYLFVMFFSLFVFACGNDDDSGAGTPNDPGTIIGSVRDAQSNNPINGVSIEISNGSTSLASISTDGNGDFEITLPAEDGLTIYFRRPGYREVVYSNVRITSNVITYLRAVLQINEGISGTGNINGIMYDAVTGQRVSGLTMKLRAGVNTNIGNILQESTTSSQGNFSFTNIQAGNYTAEVSGTSYNTLYLNLLCLGSINLGNQNGIIAPLNDTSKYRVILSWGATPSDLDLHLTGPLADGTRFHTYYSNRTPVGSNSRLDVDVTSGFGPETITLTETRAGIYRYSVHNYSNRLSTSSSVLAQSLARVIVFKEGVQIAEFNVPNQPGTLWTMFEIENEQLRPINTFSYVNAGADVPRGVLPATDAHWIYGLEDK